MARRRQIKEEEDALFSLFLFVLFAIPGGIGAMLSGYPVVGALLFVAGLGVGALLLSPKSELQSTTTVKRIRQRIPQEVRSAVFVRDGYKCRHCGSNWILEIDHIVPHSRGGSSDISNLQTLCKKCNIRKSNRFVG